VRRRTVDGSRPLGMANCCFIMVGQIGTKFYAVVWTERGEAMRLITFGRQGVKRRESVKCGSTEEIQAMRGRGETYSEGRSHKPACSRAACR
jgi:hypothetical protein